MSDGEKTRGYHGGSVDSVISVDEVARQAAAIAEDITLEHLDQLAGNESFVSIRNLVAGYGQMEILHDLDLRVGKGQSLCLIGPTSPHVDQQLCLIQLRTHAHCTWKIIFCWSAARQPSQKPPGVCTAVANSLALGTGRFLQRRQGSRPAARSDDCLAGALPLRSFVANILYGLLF